jgi:hypothetical protein
VAVHVTNSVVPRQPLCHPAGTIREQPRRILADQRAIFNLAAANAEPCNDRRKITGKITGVDGFRR